jgi:hypothetical protein
MNGHSPAALFGKAVSLVLQVHVALREVASHEIKVARVDGDQLGVHHVLHLHKHNLQQTLENHTQQPTKTNMEQAEEKQIKDNKPHKESTKHTEKKTITLNTAQKQSMEQAKEKHSKDHTYDNSE